jgi:hypothetical protein
VLLTSPACSSVGLPRSERRERRRRIQASDTRRLDVGCGRKRRDQQPLVVEPSRSRSAVGAPGVAGTTAAIRRHAVAHAGRVARIGARTDVAESPTSRGLFEPHRARLLAGANDCGAAPPCPTWKSDAAADGVHLVRRAVVDAQSRSRRGLPAE